MSQANANKWSFIGVCATLSHQPGSDSYRVQIHLLSLQKLPKQWEAPIFQQARREKIPAQSGHAAEAQRMFSALSPSSGGRFPGRLICGGASGRLRSVPSHRIMTYETHLARLFRQQSLNVRQLQIHFRCRGPPGPIVTERSSPSARRMEGISHNSAGFLSTCQRARRKHDSLPALAQYRAHNSS